MMNSYIVKTEYLDEANEYRMYSSPIEAIDQCFECRSATIFGVPVKGRFIRTMTAYKIDSSTNIRKDNIETFLGNDKILFECASKSECDTSERFAYIDKTLKELKKWIADTGINDPDKYIKQLLETKEPAN